MSVPSLSCSFCGRKFTLQGMCRAHTLAELAIQGGRAKLVATEGNTSSMQLTLNLIEDAVAASSDAEAF